MEVLHPKYYISNPNVIGFPVQEKKIDKGCVWLYMGASILVMRPNYLCKFSYTIRKMVFEKVCFNILMRIETSAERSTLTFGTYLNLLFYKG